jgi:hypothetical protein
MATKAQKAKMQESALPHHLPVFQNATANNAKPSVIKKYIIMQSYFLFGQ